MKTRVRSTAAFEPGNEKENSTTIKYTVKFYIEFFKKFKKLITQCPPNDILCHSPLCSLKYFSNILNYSKNNNCFRPYKSNYSTSYYTKSFMKFSSSVVEHFSSLLLLLIFNTFSTSVMISR